MVPTKPKRYEADLWREGETYEQRVARLDLAAADPLCKNAAECVKESAVLRVFIAAEAERESARREAVRAELADNPFDPRREVSEDARYIARRVVKHLWVLLFVIPAVAVLLVALVRALAAG